MAEPAGVTMEVGNDGVAVITMSNPPVNDLSRLILDGVKEKILQAMVSDDVKAIVLTGDGGRFAGTIDMNVFRTFQQTVYSKLQRQTPDDKVLNQKNESSKPILSEEGHILGLIEAIVPPEALLKVSRQWALDIADRHKPWN